MTIPENRWKVTLKVRNGNRDPWQITLRVEGDNKAQAKRAARGAARKLFPQARVRFGRVCHDRTPVGACTGIEEAP